MRAAQILGAGHTAWKIDGGFTARGELINHRAARVAEAAVVAHQALGLEQLSRMDMIVRPDGEPVFIEGNVAPGMTETSLAPLAFEAAGRSIGDVFCALVEQAR